MAQGKSRTPQQIKVWLDQILSEFNRRDYLASDPISICHLYEDSLDREFVALVSAIFAYGNVKSILATLNKILIPLGESPVANLLKMSDSEIRQLWALSYYRFYCARDIQNLFIHLKHAYLGYANLEELFSEGRSTSTLESLSRFQKKIRGRKQLSAGEKFMYGDAMVGTSKRWHMFLRWVVRKDEIDLGLWKTLAASELIQPLDTHLFQICSALKLTRYKNASLKAALEITEHFKKWDADDPLKYDFALCRLGVLGLKDDPRYRFG